jgi:capsular polysaccharide biosynthesis protein
MKVKESDLSKKIETLKQKIDLVPQVEAERTALNRDYNITKKKYEQLLARKESADLAQKADVSAEDVQFRVIEPPIAPQTRSGPNRTFSYTVILLGGFGLGLGIAFSLSQLNPVLIRASQLTLLTTYPVLGTVSHLNKVEITKINKRHMIVFIVSSLLIIGLYSAFVATEVMQINVYERFFS